MSKIVLALLSLLLSAAAATAATPTERGVIVDDPSPLVFPTPSDRPGLMDQMRKERRLRDMDRRIENRENAARLRNMDAERLRELNELRDERNRIERDR